MSCLSATPFCTFLDSMNNFILWGLSLNSWTLFSRLTGKNYNFRLSLDRTYLFVFWKILETSVHFFLVASVFFLLHLSVGHYTYMTQRIKNPAHHLCSCFVLGSPSPPWLFAESLPSGRRRLCFAPWPAWQRATHVRLFLCWTVLGGYSRANFSGLKAISPGLGLSSWSFLSELDVIRNTAESGQIGAGWGQQKNPISLSFPLRPPFSNGHHSATGKTRLPWQRCGSHLNTNFLLLLYILQTLSLAALLGTLNWVHFFLNGP